MITLKKFIARILTHIANQVDAELITDKAFLTTEKLNNEMSNYKIYEKYYRRDNCSIAYFEPQLTAKSIYLKDTASAYDFNHGLAVIITDSVGRLQKIEFHLDSTIHQCRFDKDDNNQIVFHNSEVFFQKLRSKPMFVVDLTNNSRPFELKRK